LAESLIIGSRDTTINGARSGFRLPPTKHWMPDDRISGRKFATLTAASVESATNWREFGYFTHPTRQNDAKL